MAIEVSLTSGSKGSVSSFSIVDFPGLTTTGSTFLQDVSNNRWFVYDSATGAYKQLNEPLESLVAKNKPIRVEDFKISIFSLLGKTAVSYGYDTIDDAISYYNSGITAWRNEAIAFNTWRDNTLSLVYDNIYSFTADGITLPSLTAGDFTGQAGYLDVALGSPSRPQLFS